MEKYIGNNNMFSFKPNSTQKFTPKTSEREDFYYKTPFGLKSNDRISSNNTSFQNLLNEKYNRDIEMIRKMQRQGVIKRISKKESLYIRKNNYGSDKEFNILNDDSKNNIFKDNNPYSLFKKHQINHTIKSNSEGHRMDFLNTKSFNSSSHYLIHDRKVSLYTKLQDSLQKYMSNHSKEYTLQGNKRFLGKSGDYYLQSKKNDTMNEVSENLDVVSAYSNNSRSIYSGASKNIPYGIPQAKNKVTNTFKKNTSVGKVVTFTKKTFSKSNLTPIPLIQKKKLKNHNEKQESSKAERTAVQIRRIEYANSMKEKSIRIRTIYDPRKIEAAVNIQAWWRIILFRNRKLIRLQAFIRGYLARKAISELISYANILNLRLTQLQRSISLPYIRPAFDIVYDNFAVEAQANDFLNVVIFIQRKIRYYLGKKFSKSLHLRRSIMKIQEVLNRRKRDPYKLIRISKLGMLKRQKRYFKFNKGFELLHRFSLRSKLNKLIKFVNLKKIIQKRLNKIKQRKLEYYFNKLIKLKKEFTKIDKIRKLVEIIKRVLKRNSSNKLFLRMKIVSKLKKNTNHNLNDFVHKINNIKEFVRILDKLLKRRSIDFNHILNKIKGTYNFDRALKYLEEYMKNQIKSKIAFFLSMFKKKFMKNNLMREMRKYILKSLIKSEEFKNTFNKKLKCLKKWKRIFDYLSENSKKDINENVNKGVKTLLRHILRNSGFFGKLRRFADNNKKLLIFKDKSKNIIFKCGRRNDKKQKDYLIARNYSKWKNSVFNDKLQGIKQKVLKFLLTRIDNKNRDIISLGYYFNKLQKSLGKLKPTKIYDFLDRMRQIQKGINKLISIRTKIPYNQLKSIQKDNIKASSLKHLLNIKQEVLNKLLLKNYLAKWHEIKEDSSLMKKAIAHLFKRVFSKRIHIKLLISEIKICFMIMTHLRANNINKINNLLRKNLNNNKENVSKKINEKLKKIICFYEEHSESIYKKKLILWGKVAKVKRVKEAAKMLIKFASKILNFRRKKTCLFILKIINYLEKQQKRLVMTRILQNSYIITTLQKLKDRIIYYSNNIKSEKLQRAFYKWRNLSKEIIEQAASKIANSFRSKIAKNKIKDLKIIKTIKKIILFKYENSKNLMKKYFDRIRDLSGIDEIKKVSLYVN